MPEPTPEPEPLLRHFRFDCLTTEVAGIVKPYAEMAATIVLKCPRNAERTIAIRKLLESMDSALRSAIP